MQSTTVRTKQSSDESYENERSAAANHLTLLVRLSRLAGFLPLFNGTTSSCWVANFLYYLFIDLVLLQIFLLCTGDIYVTWNGDYIRAAYRLINGIVYFCLVLMEIYYQAWSYRLVKMFELIHTDFTSISKNGTRERRARQLCIITSCFSTFGIIQWIVDPLIQSIWHGRELQLPLQLWYPLDVQPPLRVSLAFLLQCIAQIYFAIVVCTIVCLKITFTQLMCAQLDVLCSRVRNSWCEGMLRAEVASSNMNVFNPKIERILHHQPSCNNQEHSWSRSDRLIHLKEGDIDFMPYEDHILDTIQECVEHHLRILEFCMHHRTYFDYPLTLHTSFLVIVITAALYSAVNNFEFKTFEYVIVGLSHLFTFCYCGTIIYNESTRPADAAWEACWWSGTRRAAKELQVLMVHAARPLQLTAGPFFNLNLTNFISALKMCWSFYTLLSNLKER